MKKTALFLLFALVPMLIWAEPVEVNGLFFKLDETNKTAEVVNSPSSYQNTELVIPENINYNASLYTVTSIGESAFAFSPYLTSLNIPDNIVTVKEAAFYKCRRLETVRIGKGLQNLGFIVFADCPNLQNIVIDKDCKNYDSRDNCNAIIETSTNTLLKGCNGTIIPDGVVSIGMVAFRSCNKLNSLSFPLSLKSIGSEAFAFCPFLENIEIADGVEIIEDCAFIGCPLKTIKIGRSTKVIGPGAFGNAYTTLDDGKDWNGNPYVQSISIDPNNPFYDSRQNCNAIIETRNDSLIFGCINSVIPDGVKNIGESAFMNITDLNSIVFPESVTTISNGAFWGTGITQLNLPKNIKTIGYLAFAYCNGLTSLSIPEGCERIESSAFLGCSNLKKIEVPNQLVYLGERAFDETAWYNSQPDGLIYVANFAYKYKGIAPENTEIELRLGTTGIVDHAFSHQYIDCISKLLLPEGLIFIGNYAFEGCRLGQSSSALVFPNSLVNICERAFNSCGLTAVVLGSCISKIGNHAFVHNEFKDIFCYNTNPPTFYFYYGDSYTPNAFDEGAYSATLHVPAESIEKYKSAYGWGNFANIVAIEESDPKPTMINNVILDKQNKKDWYDLNGRKLNSEPGKRGVYINNGKKVFKN